MVKLQKKGFFELHILTTLVLCESPPHRALYNSDPSHICKVGRGLVQTMGEEKTCSQCWYSVNKDDALHCWYMCIATGIPETSPVQPTHSCEHWLKAVDEDPNIWNMPQESDH
eukprot:g11947.t1